MNLRPSGYEPSSGAPRWPWYMGSTPAHGRFLVDRDSPLCTTVYRDAGTWLVHGTAPLLDHSAWRTLRSRQARSFLATARCPESTARGRHLVPNSTPSFRTDQSSERPGLWSARLGPDSISTGSTRMISVIRVSAGTCGAGVQAMVVLHSPAEFVGETAAGRANLAVHVRALRKARR